MAYDDNNEEKSFNEDDFISYLCETLDNIKKDRKEIDPLFDEFYKDWRDIKDKKIFPWIGCANWSVPVTSTHTDSIIPRIVEGIFDINPPVKVKALNNTSFEYRDSIRAFMNWDLETHPELMEQIWYFIQNTVIYGTGFNKSYFEQERGMKTRYIEAYSVNGEIIRDSEGEIIEVSDIVSQAYDQQGVQYEIVELKEKIEGWKKYNPTNRTLDIKDVLFSSDAENIKDAWDNGIIAVKFFETKDDLRKRLKQGDNELYKNLSKIKIKNISNEKDDRELDDRERAKKYQHAYKTKKIPFYEVYCNYDIDGDGFNEKVVAIIHLETKTLLGYEEFPYEPEKCPIVAGYIKPVHGCVFGIGIPEMLYDTKREIDALHNARTDRNAINNNKPLMYTDASGFNPDIHKFGPGRNWEMDSIMPEDIRFLDAPNNEYNSQKEEDLVLQYAQKRSGITDHMVGVADSKNKTATGIMALIKEGNILFRHYIRWISLAIGEILDLRWALYRQFWGEAADDEVNEWVQEILDNPDNPLSNEGLEAFKQHMNVYMTAYKESKDYELTKAQATYDIAMNNPIISQFPQALREFTVDLLRKVGYSDAEEKVPTIDQINEQMIKIQQEAIRRELAEQNQPQGGNPNAGQV